MGKTIRGLLLSHIFLTMQIPFKFLIKIANETNIIRSALETTTNLLSSALNLPNKSINTYSSNIYEVSHRLSGYVAETAQGAINCATTLIYENIKHVVALDKNKKQDLLDLVLKHCKSEFVIWFSRRILHTSSNNEISYIRRRLEKYFKDHYTSEVSVKRNKNSEWNFKSWFYRRIESKNKYHRSGFIDRGFDLPKLETVEDVKKLIKIKSSKVLHGLLFGDKSYIKFTIPKRDGGERTIHAPNKILKRIQRIILDEILNKIPVNSSAHGFIIGRSVQTNAQSHTNKDVVIKFDIKDFFPSIDYIRVLGLFVNLGYPVGNWCLSAYDKSSAVALLLAKLCTLSEQPVKVKYKKGTTPQGAPTSPAITNIVCRKMDLRFNKLALKMGGVYSRYADDLTFSFLEYDRKKISRLKWWVGEILFQEGFTVKLSKFRVIHKSRQQNVTGVVVNSHTNLDRCRRKLLRAMIHNCKKNGLHTEAKKDPKFKGDVKAFWNYMHGLASYWKMLEPHTGTKILMEVTSLSGVSFD